MTSETKLVRIIRMPEVLLRTGYKSRGAIYRLMSVGLFPKNLKMSGAGPTSPSGWLESEVDEWIATRAQQRFQDGEATKNWARARQRGSSAVPGGAVEEVAA